jgi:PAS domain S-box-containing protein
MREGKGWNLDLPFVTAHGRPICVRAVGEAAIDAGARVCFNGAIQDLTARKLPGQRIADDERVRWLVTESLPVRSACIDRRPRNRLVNHAHVRRSGMERDSIVGRTQAEITGEHLAESFAKHFAAALASQPQRLEFEEQDPNGSRHPNCQVLPGFSDRREVLGLLTTTFDITERSRAVQVLRGLTAIIEATTDFVVQTDWHGNIGYLNPAVRAAVGPSMDGSLAEPSFAGFDSDATNVHFAE